MAASLVRPVFLLAANLPAADSLEYTTSEICSAAEKVCGYQTFLGAQRIGGLWRVYPSTEESRQSILIRGMTLRGISVTVRDRNPYMVKLDDGTEREQELTRLVVGNVPLSFSDEEITKALVANGFVLRSKLIAEKDRDKNGKLTRWLTGRRFCYIPVPDQPQPRFMQMGPFKASIYYKEQKAQVKCGRCLQMGHSTKTCPNDIKCKQCFGDNHKAGDPQCPMFPPPPATQEEGSPTEPPQSTSASTTVGDPVSTQKVPAPAVSSPAKHRSRSVKRKQSTLGSLIHRRDSSSAKRVRSPDDSVSSRDKQARGDTLADPKDQATASSDTEDTAWK